MPSVKIASNNLIYDLFGRLRGYRNPVTNTDVFGFDATEGRLIDGDLTITGRNADQYDGAVLEFSDAHTVTLSSGLPEGFGFAIIPPASGNASIAADGVTLNGAGTTVTREGGNSPVAVIQKPSSVNAYIVTGA